MSRKSFEEKFFTFVLPLGLGIPHSHHESPGPALSLPSREKTRLISLKQTKNSFYFLLNAKTFQIMAKRFPLIYLFCFQHEMEVSSWDLVSFLCVLQGKINPIWLKEGKNPSSWGGCDT